MQNLPALFRQFRKSKDIIAIWITFILLTFSLSINSAQAEDDIATPFDVTNIWRVSVANNGVQGNNDSSTASISADGRYVAFRSFANNLIANDTNGQPDIFVHDRQMGQTTRVSVTSNGTQSNNGSYKPSISADGRYVAFESNANNLVANDTNGRTDIFVHDRQTGQTTRVSVASNGTQVNNGSYEPSISADGRYVAFESTASNLVANDTNGQTDVFIHDRQTGQTTRVSVASNGTQGNSPSYKPNISGDGRYVTFYADASNLVLNDTNGRTDIFVHDRQMGQTTRVSVANAGTQANNNSEDPTISADGRYVAFRSEASNLVANDTNNVSDVFVHDRQTGQTNRISIASNGTQAHGSSYEPAISADGRYVAFHSNANNLVVGDSNGVADVFRHDRQTGQISRVSVTSNGVQTSGHSSNGAAISADGRYVSFWSAASNLVTGDSNNRSDIFVAELSSTLPLAAETLALFNPSTGGASLLNTLQNQPPIGAYNNFTPGAPINGQWVMGDWDGNGTDTPAVFANGAVYLTNTLGATANWSAHWIGPNGTLIAGRFNPALSHDCLGVVEQAFLNPHTVFVLYYACNFTTTTPIVTWHWMSAALYDPSLPGLAGDWQFAIGDWNNNGTETPAIRRGPYVAFSNIPIVDANFAGSPPFSPNNTGAEFVGAQYIGAPNNAEYGHFVTGDWDGNGIATFGLFYPNTNNFYYYNNLDWVPGAPSLQSITNYIDNPRNVVSWQPAGGSLTAEIKQPLQTLGGASLDTQFEELAPLQYLELKGNDLQDMQPLD